MGRGVQIRTYGTSGPPVVVLHGGPGAPGQMAPVARGLADSFRAIEPFQRGSGDEPLTVAGHVSDLGEVVRSQCVGARPALVGSSWGAMLALAYAAAHPDQAGPLVLIGCGTFDETARRRMQTALEERMSAGLKQRLERLQHEVPEPDQRLKAMGDLLLPAYSCELIDDCVGESLECDARSNQETWDDMLRLQSEGLYPAAFGAIRSPVLMLHGALDPHPGRMIRASLEPWIPQIEYVEWERCGHYPWLEKAVREEFFSTLRRWLSRHLR
jgi:pimeloyl-ACP methyl ester carboxylesterase